MQSQNGKANLLTVIGLTITHAEIDIVSNTFVAYEFFSKLIWKISPTYVDFEFLDQVIINCSFDRP